jgi:hypothetical protein
MKKYVDYNPVNGKDDKIDEEVLDTLNLKAEVHKYEDLENTIKKRKRFVETLEPKIKTLTKKSKIIKIINVFEILIISLTKICSLTFIILGFVKVANAQSIKGFNSMSCREAVDSGICQLQSIGMRWSYAILGYEEDTYQNCWIGGDTSEILSKECEKDPFCFYQRLDERCNDYCFMGYDTITYRKYNVSKSLINVYTGFTCGILATSHDLSCPYGFVFVKEKAYCLNNDGHISKNWMVLPEENDKLAMKEFESDVPPFCSGYSKMIYKGTVQHFNPNECIVYDEAYDNGNVLENCPPLYITPINDTHGVVACTDMCYDKLEEVGEGGFINEKYLFPCNSVVSFSKENFIGCRFKYNAGGLYDKEKCGTYETGGMETVPEKPSKDQMSGFQKLPRFIWLVVLAVLELFIVFVLVKLM